MTTVYRIESLEGHGMYRAGLGCPVEDDPRRHPLPRYDSLLMSSDFPYGASSHLLYGFISIEQLRSWIYRDEWLLDLHVRGFVLAVIESEEVYVGNTQAVFLRPAEYARHSIAEYFKL